VCSIHGVPHTTSVLETDCLTSKWHIARLPPNSAKRCWVLRAITGTMCNAKVGTGKHGTPAPTYKGLNKEFGSRNNMEYEFWFCLDDIKRCVSDGKKNVLDWPIVPNTWPVNIGTNLSRERRFWHLKMLNFNYNRGKHCHLVVGFQQSQLSPFLARIFFKHGRPPYIQVWEDSAS